VVGLKWARASASSIHSLGSTTATILDSGTQAPVEIAYQTQGLFGIKYFGVDHGRRPSAQ